jgi:hypothetical protein
VSTWGSRNGLAGYDEFRTGLTFREVKRLMFDNHTDRSRWKYKRRRTVLGAWHELKLSLYYQAVDDARPRHERRRAA